jgi:hypothetical protein
VVVNQFHSLRLSESVWKSCTKIDSQAVGIIFNPIIRTRLATYRVAGGGGGAAERNSPPHNFLFVPPCKKKTLNYQMNKTEKQTVADGLHYRHTAL